MGREGEANSEERVLCNVMPFGNCAAPRLGVWGQLCPRCVGDEGRGVRWEAQALPCSGLAQQLEKAFENPFLGHKNKQTPERWTSQCGACVDTDC